MKKKDVFHLIQAVGIAAIAFMLVVQPVSGNLPAVVPMVTDDVGYVAFSYGTGVNREPTADNPESKLWYNDGLWWGILFDSASNQYAIYQFNWSSKTWTKTATNVDSRMDTNSTEVDTRFDALWDGTKLYLASHLQMPNPSRTTNAANRGQLNRYSYNASTKTYTLDEGFPVNVSMDKTATMVLDKDSSGRLWVTYVSRLSTEQIYRVYVNYTVTPGDDLVWATPIDMSMSGFSPTGAIVTRDDVSSVIAYKDKVGVMWSNGLDGRFYFAEISAGSPPATAGSWDIQPVNVSGILRADDHIKLVANDAGQVFAAIKTSNTGATESLTGVLARDTGGSFSFHVFSNSSSNDTHPTLTYHKTENKLYMFVASNEAGGLICVNSMEVKTPLSSMGFDSKPCSSDTLISATHFIQSSTYTKINNPTTAKRPVDSTSGVLVLASDQDNGQMYLHNTLGGSSVVTPPPPPPGNLRLYIPMISH